MEVIPLDVLLSYLFAVKEENNKKILIINTIVMNITIYSLLLQMLLVHSIITKKCILKFLCTN